LPSNGSNGYDHSHPSKVGKAALDSQQTIANLWLNAAAISPLFRKSA
jgi:hypothetical protein